MNAQGYESFRQLITMTEVKCNWVKVSGILAQCESLFFLHTVQLHALVALFFQSAITERDYGISGLARNVQLFFIRAVFFSTQSLYTKIVFEKYNLLNLNRNLISSRNPSVSARTKESL